MSVVILALLSACGGGGSEAANITRTNAQAPTTGFQPGVFSSADTFRHLCEAPRTGVDPGTNRAYLDRSGSTLDENNWLRSWSNELYLWYEEITDVDPSGYETDEYFDLMKSFTITPSGAPKDRFHFDMPTSEWQALSQSGVSAGYGAQFALLSSSPPRQIVVAYTEPDSPATSQQVALVRGTIIQEIDGVDVVNATGQDNVDVLNAGLFPDGLGETHEFLVQDPDGSDPRLISMTSASITSDPVQNAKVISTATGNVGYVLFNDHIATAEAELIDAINWLRTQNLNDLVVDLRYNGGGYLDIANELAFMIAGPTQAAGQTFDELRFNDKHQQFDPVTGRALSPTPFRQTARGFSVAEGLVLPSLNLSRVFLLTGPGTCSASEAIINGLRGIDVEVVQVGSTTCGKPYGFYPFDNCGTTYFSIQFRGANAKGFGDYPDGFSPADLPEVEGVSVTGCAVADDFSRPLGDPTEARLATALAYQASGVCPSNGSSERALQELHPLNGNDGVTPKSFWKTNRIMSF